MNTYTDQLGREYIHLDDVSSLLSKSHKQVRRYVRDFNWLYHRKGLVRGDLFIHTNDIVKHRPELEAQILSLKQGHNGQIRDIKHEKDVPNVPNDLNQDIELYSVDKKLEVYRAEIRGLATRLERSLSSVQYTKENTDKLLKGLVKTDKEIGEIKARLNKPVKKTRIETAEILLKIVALVFIVGMSGLLAWKIYNFTAGF